MAPKRILNWGLLGTARINEKIIPLLKEYPLANAYAVASRDEQKAASYAEKWDLERSFGRYDALLDDPAVDVVYLSLPNHLHVEWALEAILRGKHVLCEKPLALDAAEVQSLSKAAVQHGVVVTEGFMYRHHRQTLRLRELIDEGRIGILRGMRGSFHFTIAPGPNIRLDPAAGGGAIWDLGCYLTSLMGFIAGGAPESVFGRADFGPSGVDEGFTAQLHYARGVSGNFDCSFHAPRTDTFEIIGTAGILRVPHPFKPTVLETLTLVTSAGTEAIEVSDARNPYLPQIENLTEAVFSHAQPRVTLAESLAVTATLQALLKSAKTGQLVKVSA